MYQIHGLAGIFSGLFATFHHFNRLVFVYASRDLGLYHVQKKLPVFSHEAGLLVEALGEAFQFFVVDEVALVGPGDEAGVDFGFQDAGLAVVLNFFSLFRRVCLKN